MNDQAKLKSATKNVGTLELDPNILTLLYTGSGGRSVAFLRDF